MSFSDETLMAYADGELDAATRAQIEAALATDADLAQRIARQRQLRARLQAAFEPVLDEPLPPRLLESAQRFPGAGRADNVVPLRRTPAPRWSWSQWGAMAASLLLGVLAAALLLAPTGGPIITRHGEMLAGGTLARALTAQLASRQPPDAPVQIGVSFRARSGLYCRSFVLRDKAALAGLACRDQGAWRVQMLAAAAAAAPAGTGAYRSATSALPPQLAQAIDELIAGEPLDAQTEAAARERGWTP
jgi:anti-sigma-K factor RskA